VPHRPTSDLEVSVSDPLELIPLENEALEATGGWLQLSHPQCGVVSGNIRCVVPDEKNDEVAKG